MSEDRKSTFFDRRKFVTALAASGTAAPALLAQQQTPPAQNPNQNPGQQAAQNPQQRRERPPEVQPFQGPITFTRQDVPAKVEPFPMTQVRLNDGIFKDAQEVNRKVLLGMPADRLLHNFRVNAGLPSSAEPLGGWEIPPDRATRPRESELRGHYVGHFLSACALMYASTGDKDIKAKGDYLVAELAKCQEKLGGKYLSAFPTEFWDRLDKRQGVWAPFYTIHKIMAGFLDMYELAGNKQALDVLKGMAAWADEWTAQFPEEHMQQILTTEYGGIAETLYSLAAITNDGRWAKAGDRFQKKVFINPLALRKDELRGLHVNTHVPQVIAAARRYEISGDMRFHDVADYFWYEVVSARSYVTTGTSNGESWQVEPRRLAAELPRSVSTQECCCSYNMLKLTRHLYSWTADPRYFDYYERSLLNMRLGTIDPDTGATEYYLSLTPGAWKTFNTEFGSFWCCTGSGVEEYSKLNDSIYWRDADGIYVNLFIASELNWAEKGIRLKQETTFPTKSGTTLVVTAQKPTQMAMRIRIPEWANGGTVKINGKALEALASRGSYLAISRTWKTGDKVEVELPMKLRIERMPDDPTMIAFLYGPVVLAGELGSEGLTKDRIYGPNAPQMRRDNAGRGPIGGPPQGANQAQLTPEQLAQRQRQAERMATAPPAIPMPVLKVSGNDPASWLQAVTGTPLAFKTAGQAKDFNLRPIKDIFGQRYTVYWKLS